MSSNLLRSSSLFCQCSFQRQVKVIPAGYYALLDQLISDCSLRRSPDRIFQRISDHLDFRLRPRLLILTEDSVPLLKCRQLIGIEQLKPFGQA